MTLGKIPQIDRRRIRTPCRARCLSEAAGMRACMQQAAPTTQSVSRTVDRWIADIRACELRRPRTRGYLKPKTIESYTAWLKRFREDFHGRSWRSITESDVLEWLDRQGRSSHAAGCTLQRVLNRSGMAHLLPDPRHWRREPEPRYWRPGDYVQAFDAMVAAYQSAEDRGQPRNLYLCGVLIALTGLRRQEAASLRWSDMTPEWLRVRGKGDRVRRVPRTQQVNEVLAAASPPGGTASQWVFPSERKRWTDVHVTEGAVSRRLRKVFDEAGLPSFNTHELRRCFISWQHAQGIDDHVIARTTGHSVDVLRRYYLMLEWPHQLDAAAQLGASLSRQGRLF